MSSFELLILCSSCRVRGPTRFETDAPSASSFGVGLPLTVCVHMYVIGASEENTDSPHGTFLAGAFRSASVKSTQCLWCHRYVHNHVYCHRYKNMSLRRSYCVSLYRVFCFRQSYCLHVVCDLLTHRLLWPIGLRLFVYSVAFLNH